eukprot:3949318-Prorocentrum_lima.AAC.1
MAVPQAAINWRNRSSLGSRVADWASNGTRKISLVAFNCADAMVQRLNIRSHCVLATHRAFNAKFVGKKADGELPDAEHCAYSVLFIHFGQ